MSTIHHRLRDALAVVREAAEDAETPEIPVDLLVYCRAFCTALDGHHRGEGDALFPRLRAIRPDLADAIGKLLQDHSMIDHLLGGLQAASTKGGPRDVIRHLDGIEPVMTTHFRYEEKVLAAALDELHDETLDVPTAFGPL